MSMVKIAVVQPHTSPPPDDARNVEDAVRWIGRAASDGADFVCFPESYPGPWRMPAAYDPTSRIAAAAQKHRVHVVFGTLEPIDDAKRTAYNLTCMAYPDGRAPVRYRRTHPNGPWIIRAAPAAAGCGSSSGCRATTSRFSTRSTARSGSACAARSTCPRCRGRWRCAGRR